MGFFRKSNVKLQARKRRLKILFRGLKVCVGILLLTFAFRYLSLHIEKLKIQSIVVEGSGGALNTASVLNRAGVKVGTPLFAVKLREVVRKLQEDPWVDQVRVSRKIPHTLLIHVTQHEPQFILSVGKFYYVGLKGEVFKELTSRVDSKDFPIFTGLKRQEIEQDPAHAREIFGQAISLLSSYESIASVQKLGVSEIHYDKAEGFSVFPEKGKMRIVVGLDHFETKFNRLSLALEKLKQMKQSFASIDLNYQGKVILTL